MFKALKKFLQSQNLKMTFNYKTQKFEFSKVDSSDVFLALGREELSDLMTDTTAFLDEVQAIVSKLESLFSDLNG
jgi:hypothetical protein